MTSTDPALCTRAPTTGLSTPAMARAMAQEVQRHGKAHVELDGGHHPPGEGEEMRQLLHLVVHKGDVRRVHRYVAAHAAHGYADLGPASGRGRR